MASFISDEEMQALEAKQPKPKGFISDEEMMRLEGGQVKKQYSPVDVIKRKGVDVLPGLGSLAAGVGGAIGAGYGTLTTPRDIPFSQRLSEAGKAAKEGFFESRDEANLESEEMSKQYPKLSMATEIGSGLLTAPLATAKGISGAAKLGLLSGTTQGLATENDLEGVAKSAGTGAALGGAIGAAGKGLSKLAASSPVQKGVGYLKDKAAKAGAKIGKTFTGISEQNIKTFAKHTDDVEKIINEYGDDIASASDDVREKIQGQLRTYRSSQSAKIGAALEKSNPEKIVDPKPIFEQLNKIKQQINPNYYPEVAENIDGIVKKIMSEAGPDGKLSLRQLHEAKEFLQDQASGSYMKGGQIFQLPDKAAKAAKVGAAEARKILNDLAPDIKDANNQLSKLHILEKKINKNLIAPGKAESALMSAGAGNNNRSQKALKEIGNIIGSDVLGEAQKLSAARTFGNVSLLPTDTTGKALLRAGTASGIGYALGGQDAAGAAALLSSPAALKYGIKGAKGLMKRVPSISREAIESTAIRNLIDKRNGN